MEPSTAAYELIKKWEGLSLRACKAIPTEKYYTIGYGHYGPDVQKGQLITQQRAEELMYRDVASFAPKLSQKCEHLTQRQYDALVSLIYNIGWYNFSTSMTFNYARLSNWQCDPLLCARRIILWIRAGGQVLLGLVHRRIDEANYFLGYEHFRLKDGQICEYYQNKKSHGK